MIMIDQNQENIVDSREKGTMMIDHDHDHDLVQCGWGVETAPEEGT